MANKKVSWVERDFGDIAIYFLIIISLILSIYEFKEGRILSSIGFAFIVIILLIHLIVIKKLKNRE